MERGARDAYTSLMLQPIRFARRSLPMVTALLFLLDSVDAIWAASRAIITPKQ